MITEFKTLVGEIEKLLRTSVVLDASDITSTWSFQDTANGIKKTPEKRRGRTDEEIDSDVLKGKTAEVAVAKILGVDTFDVEWDLKDRETWAKDVVYKDIRIEIKSTHYRTLFSVPQESYNTMTKNAELNLIDLVLFVHVERLECGGFRATPSLIVDPYPDGYAFGELFERKSDEYGGFKYVYPASKASERNLCYPLVEL